MTFMVFRVFVINSVSLGLVVYLILKEIFTCYHSDQRALSVREVDVTLSVVGTFQGETQLHSEFVFIIISKKYHTFCLGRIILFCCIYLRNTLMTGP